MKVRDDDWAMATFRGEPLEKWDSRPLSARIADVCVEADSGLPLGWDRDPLLEPEPRPRRRRIREDTSWLA